MLAPPRPPNSKCGLDAMAVLMRAAAMPLVQLILSWQLVHRGRLAGGRRL